MSQGTDACNELMAVIAFGLAGAVQAANAARAAIVCRLLCFLQRVLEAG